MAALPDTTITNGAVERLYREYRTLLCAYVRRRFGPGPPDPEDITNEAFVRLARKSGEEIPNPKAFLLVTARNVAIDAHRRQQRSRSALDSVRILEENYHDLDTFDVLSSKEELERLAAVVDTLKPRQRVAFLLHRVDGLTFVEIARRLSISQSGARLLVETALATCMKQMKRT